VLEVNTHRTPSKQKLGREGGYITLLIMHYNQCIQTNVQIINKVIDYIYILSRELGYITYYYSYQFNIYIYIWRVN